MRNITGAFVVYGPTVEPYAVLLSPDELAHYRQLPDWKANRIMFGAGIEYALPCTTACMERIALEYADDAPQAALLKPLCAAIALGKPIGGDRKGKGDGGTKVPADAPKPRKPRPGGQAATPESAFAQLMTG